MTLESRITKFWSRVDKQENGCWIYPNKDKQGYGFVHLGGSKKKPIAEGAHRLSYRLAKGEIPKGLHLDHLCRTPSCVNPDHLEPVTWQENIMRSPLSLAVINKNKIVCLRGHNRWGRQKRGRKCLECCRLRARGEI